MWSGTYVSRGRRRESLLRHARRLAAASSPTALPHYAWHSGAGFDSDAVVGQDGHWGVLGMRERANRIGASLVLSSQPGAGTVFSLVVPYRRGLRTRL